MRGGQENEFECSYDKDIDNLWSQFLFMCSLEPFFYYRFFPSHWFPRLWTSQLESQLERVTALTWTIISSIYRYLVHFCQIRIGKQVTFWTNAKQSTIEHTAKHHQLRTPLNNSYLLHSTDHNDFRAKFLQFMSELWIDPEVSLIMSVGEPSDFLSDDAVISDNETIVSLPGFHLVILICQTSNKVLGSILFTVKIQIMDTRYPNMWLSGHSCCPVFE